MFYSLLGNVSYKYSETFLNDVNKISLHLLIMYISILNVFNRNMKSLERMDVPKSTC